MSNIPTVASLSCGEKSSFCTRCFVFIVVCGKTGKTFCCKHYFSVVVVWGKTFSMNKIPLLLLGGENHLFANVISQSFLCGEKHLVWIRFNIVVEWGRSSFCKRYFMIVVVWGKTFSVTSTFFPKDTKTRRRGCHFPLNLFRFVSDVKKMSI